MMATEKIDTEAMKRFRHLRNKFSCSDIPVEFTENGRPRMTRFNNCVKKRVKEEEEARWIAAVRMKPSLSLYGKWKQRGKIPYGFYQNSRGSALMALARAGMLPTRKHRGKYQRIDTICVKCGVEEETIPHVIMECTPHHYEADELARRLGFTGDSRESTWRETRTTLEKWENETRRIC